ncbi:MAG TPA: aldolase/citrate lyase family protein [Beijerinckiaceae bacterium]|nr:aldolase/citrate lyase family protein [Beijerinckiaceae bacterium]
MASAAVSSLTALAERLNAGGPVFSAWCGLAAAAVPALLAREDFDAVTLDMQHGAFDYAEVVAAIPLIAAAGKPALVRIPIGDFAMAARLLDAGASAIIAPMINTVEDARRFAAFTKFPPEGERSWGPHGAIALSGLAPADYLRNGNTLTLALAMIETREALGALDAILGLTGIDGVFIGPGDLSIALSDGAVLDPMGAAVDEALDHVLARCRAAGKRATIYAHSPERAARLAGKGFDLIAIGGDTAFLRAGAQAALKTARS